MISLSDAADLWSPVLIILIILSIHHLHTSWHTGGHHCLMGGICLLAVGWKQEYGNKNKSQLRGMMLTRNIPDSILNLCSVNQVKTQDPVFEEKGGWVFFAIWPVNNTPPVEMRQLQVPKWSALILMFPPVKVLAMLDFSCGQCSIQYCTLQCFVYLILQAHGSQAFGFLTQLAPRASLQPEIVK